MMKTKTANEVRNKSSAAIEWQNVRCPAISVPGVIAHQNVDAREHTGGKGRGGVKYYVFAATYILPVPKVHSIKMPWPGLATVRPRKAPPQTPHPRH